jgi:hypothetical protein
MSQLGNLRVLLTFLLSAHGLYARAQTDELLPEIDAYYKMQSGSRLLFQAKETREGGEPTTAEIGPSLNLYMKPWIKLKNIATLDLDDTEARPLLFSIGYRYLPYPDAPSKHRLEPYLTPRFPLIDSLVLSDRNRTDLDWQNGTLTWEYRNRPQLERTFAVRSYHFSPYLSAESFYQSRYEKWSDTVLYAGSLFPIGKHAAFNPYYEHQNNTGKKPNQRLNQFGLLLDLYF